MVSATSGLRRARFVQRWRAAAAADEGFTLVEVVVALVISAIAFSALGLALISGVHASALAQQNQQAGDLLNQTVEKVRAMSYSSVAMRDSDLDTGDVRSPSLSSALVYAPKTDLTSGAGTEPLAARDPAGSIYPHVTTTSQNGLVFTVRRYVTAPVDPFGAVYKRLTVVVKWTSLGKPHTRTYTSIISPTRRGLPLPDYKFTSTGSGLSQCRNPGSTVVYSFQLKNNGARDSWSIAAAGGGPWSFFFDTDGNGIYDSTVDATMAATGTASTGLLEPNTTSKFFAVAVVPSGGSPTPPYTWSTTFRATSAAQPGYFSDLVATTGVQTTPCGAVATPTPTASATATASPTASPTPSPTPTSSIPAQPAASCSSITGAMNGNAPSGTTVRYYLFNSLTGGSTNALLDMPATRDGGTPPTATSLYSYSQDLTTSAGRYLTTGTTGTGIDLASWTYQMPAASTVKGTGAFTMYATVASGSTTSNPAFSVSLERLSSAGAVLETLDTATYTSSGGWGCTGMRPFSVQFSLNGSGTVVAANEKLRVKVKVTNSVPMLLAYGTSAYPAELQLPYKTGVG